MPRGVKPVITFGGLYGGSNTSVLQVSGGLLPSSSLPMRPGTPALANQIEPSTGLTMIPYAKPDTRMSRAGSGFSFGCVYAPIRPSPLVSTTSGHQPWAFAASPVSSHTRVLIQPMTLVSPEK
jgi:hypothetical protein